MTLGGPSALAAPSFANDDLKGEYPFTVVEVHRVVLPGSTTFAVEHCVIAGTANFDGIGTMTLNAMQRCSITGSGTIVGQLVEHGRTLLLDGTLRTLPDILNWSGVAMRR